MKLLIKLYSISDLNLKLPETVIFSNFLLKWTLKTYVPHGELTSVNLNLKIGSKLKNRSKSGTLQVMVLTWKSVPSSNSKEPLLINCSEECWTGEVMPSLELKSWVILGVVYYVRTRQPKVGSRAYFIVLPSPKPFPLFLNLEERKSWPGPYLEPRSLFLPPPFSSGTVQTDKLFMKWAVVWQGRGTLGNKLNKWENLGIDLFLIHDSKSWEGESYWDLTTGRRLWGKWKYYSFLFNSMGPAARARHRSRRSRQLQTPIYLGLERI